MMIYYESFQRIKQDILDDMEVYFISFFLKHRYFDFGKIIDEQEDEV